MTDRPVAVVALVVALVASTALAGVGGASHGSDAPIDGADTHEPVDEIYVTEDGDAVLVDESDSTDPSTDVEYGANVSSGLVYGLLTNPAAASEDVQAELMATVTPGNVSADGRLVVPRPDSLRSLTLDVDSQTTENVSELDTTLDTSFNTTGMMAFVDSASTSGTMTTSADRFSADGQFNASFLMGSGDRQQFAMTVTEDDGVYTVAVEQDQPVPFSTEDWQNRSAARETIASQYRPLAEETGGNASITIDEYAFENGTDPRVDIAYTVTYRDVEPGLREQLQSQLVTDPEINETQAAQIASEATNATIENLAVRYETGGGEISGSFDVDVTDYEGLLVVYQRFAATGAMTPTSTEAAVTSQWRAEQLEQLREQFAAQRAADSQQQLTWSAALSQPDDATTQVTADIEQNTTNWGAYVEEREQRDLPTPESRFELTGDIEGEEVVFAGSASLSGDRLFEQYATMVEERIEVLDSYSNDSRTTRLFDALERSAPQKATLEATYDESGTRVEVGAAFGNLAALRDELASQANVSGEVTEIVGRTADNRTTTYVRIDGALGSGATESDVRALAFVDEDTTVNMPGDWDREFPSMDIDRAEAFLGDTAVGASGPGFGLVAALGALVAVAVFLGRRD